MGSAPVYTGETRTYLTSNLTSPRLGSHPLPGSQGLVNCVLCASLLSLVACFCFLLQWNGRGELLLLLPLKQ